MKIIIEIGHPAHVHAFKYTMKKLQAHGHQVKLVARDKDITIHLLNDYGMDYTSISRRKKGLVNLAFELLQRDWELYKIALKSEPDVFLSIAGTPSAHIAWLLGKTSVTFDDSEFARMARATWLPFTTYVCTPQSYQLNLGKKQIRYNGCHELAYLHPNRFKPDPQILQQIGLSEQDPFFIIRFVSFEATHDIGESGSTLAGRKRLVEQLQKYGRVIITSEAPLPPEFEPYRLSVSPTKMHDLLNYCSLYIGEGLTMASEAAILGVPSILVNTLNAGTLIEQEFDYGLLHRIPEEGKAIEKAVSIASSPTARKSYQANRLKFLADKIDVTAWLVNFIEHPDHYDKGGKHENHSCLRTRFRRE